MTVQARADAEFNVRLVQFLTIWIGWLVFATVFFALFLIPTFVAFRRHHPNRRAIFAINVGLGGTVIAWVGALVWAYQAVHLSPTGSDGGESGLNLFANDPALASSVPTPTTPRRAHEVAAYQLQRLKTLYNAGAISAEEYAAMRKPLIDKLSA